MVVVACPESAATNLDTVRVVANATQIFLAERISPSTMLACRQRVTSAQVTIGFRKNHPASALAEKEHVRLVTVGTAIILT